MQEWNDSSVKLLICQESGGVTFYRAEWLKERPDMTSTKFSKFLTPSPLSALGPPLLRPLFHDPLSPSDADIISGGSLGGALVTPLQGGGGVIT